MALDNIAFDQISHDHLLQLIDNGYSEDRFTEYKRDAVGTNDEQRREFLKDVSAFANASGGFIVIGMDADKGVPKKLIGVAVPNMDQEIQRLVGMINDNIEPRLTGVQIKPVPQPRGNPAIVIRVQRSWNPPHRVSHKNYTKFFVRNSNGVHEMNVQELRSQFLGSASLADRIRGFREERINVIRQNAGAARIASEHKLALHVVPFGFLADEVLIDVQTAYTLREWFHPLGSRTSFYGGYSPYFNFDGVSVVAGTQQDGTVQAYTQVFRNGIVESVVGDILYALRDEDQPKFLRAVPLEKTIVADLPPICEGLAKLQVGPPVIVLLTLINVYGSKIRQALESSPALDRHHLRLPMVTLDTLNLTGNWHHLLKVQFDAMWNAYDHAFSPSFKDGVWKPPQH